MSCLRSSRKEGEVRKVLEAALGAALAVLVGVGWLAGNLDLPPMHQPAITQDRREPDSGHHLPTRENAPPPDAVRVVTPASPTYTGTVIGAGSVIVMTDPDGKRTVYVVRVVPGQNPQPVDPQQMVVGIGLILLALLAPFVLEYDDRRLLRALLR